MVSWVIPTIDFVLQQNSDVTTTNWATVTTPPTLNSTNVRYQVTVPARLGPAFYRLISQ